MIRKALTLYTAAKDGLARAIRVSEPFKWTFFKLSLLGGVVQAFGTTAFYICIDTSRTYSGAFKDAIELNETLFEKTALSSNIDLSGLYAITMLSADATAWGDAATRIAVIIQITGYVTIATALAGIFCAAGSIALINDRIRILREGGPAASPLVDLLGKRDASLPTGEQPAAATEVARKPPSDWAKPEIRVQLIAVVVALFVGLLIAGVSLYGITRDEPTIVQVPLPSPTPQPSASPTD